MSSIQIPSIEFKDNRIQKCSIIINKQTFNVKYSDDKYTVTKGDKSEKESPKVVETETSSASAASETSKPAAESESASKPGAKSSSKSSSKIAAKPKAAKVPKVELNVSDIQNAAKAFSKMKK